MRASENVRGRNHEQHSTQSLRGNYIQESGREGWMEKAVLRKSGMGRKARPRDVCKNMSINVRIIYDNGCKYNYVACRIAVLRHLGYSLKRFVVKPTCKLHCVGL